MDLKTQKKTLELLYKLLDGTNGIVPFVEYSPQKQAFPDKEEKQRLKRAIPETQGISSVYLKTFLEELVSREKKIHGIMVIRNGCVLAETVLAPYQMKLWHATYSLCKSITGMAIGMLIDEGRLKLDDRVVDILSSKVNPISYLKYKNLTIRHLLTMTSGASFNEMGSATETDWIKGYFDSHVRFTHGSQFCYNSMNSYMLSAVVTEVTGQTMMEYLNNRLWEPLGITNVYWESCPMGRTKGGWGLYLTMEDMAKIGQMYLQKGLWKGKRILSENWIASSCQKQVDTGEENGYSYGYHNWIAEEEHAYLFNGMFGQNVLIYPDKRMILVTVAGNNELFADGLMMQIIRSYFGNDFQPDDSIEMDQKGYEALKKFEKKCMEIKPIKAPLFGGWPWKGTVGTNRWRKKYILKGREERKIKGENLWDILLKNICQNKYRMENTKGSLVPRFLQVVHNNYSEGIETIQFVRCQNKLLMTINEGNEVYGIILPETYQIQTICYHGEEYSIAAKGEAAKNEDGILVLKIDIRFIETPHRRKIKCFVYDKKISVHFDEEPGWNMIQKALSTVAQADSSVLMQGLMTKLDREYIEYKIRSAVKIDVTGELIEK